MSIIALLWSPGMVSVQSLTENGNEELANVDIPSAIGMHRYDLAIYKEPTITIRLPGGSRSPFLCSWDKGKTFQRLDPIPGNGALNPNGCRSHTNGILTAIDSHVLWVKPPNLDIWLRSDFPSELKVHDLSFDFQGRIHLVGEIQSNRLPEAKTEAFYGILQGGEVSFFRLAMTDDDIQMLESLGGSEAFRKIDAENLPILLASDCAWLFEDSSSFLLAFSGESWTVKRLKQKAIRTWIREGTGSASVFTTEGSRYRTHDGGVTWKEQDLISSVRKAWTGSMLQTPIVMSAALKDYLVITVSSYDWQAASSEQLLGSAVLVSYDDGETFEVKAIVEGGKEEFLGILIV